MRNIILEWAGFFLAQLTTIVNGMPGFIICGLADKAITESKERIKSVLSCIGVSLPSQRIVVSLAPANIRKEGSHYDLPIALAILKAMGHFKTEIVDYLVIGELGLKGKLVGVGNALIAANKAKQCDMKMICPASIGPEVALIEGINIIAVDSLLELLQVLNGKRSVAHPKPANYTNNLETLHDFRDIKGCENIKRALTIATHGRYNVLLIGSPGAGKSTICSALRSIQPPMSLEESLEVSQILGATGLLNTGLVTQRPFRNPHHTASRASIIGGTKHAKPGEISMAHKGILFLDELTLWPADILNALREAMQNKEVTISRAESNAVYPADFQLIAATNPCPCGNAYNANVSCSKLPFCVKNYLSKLPGPFLDRMHMIVRMDPISPWEIDSAPQTEDSKTILGRIVVAQAFQQALRIKDAKDMFFEEASIDFLNKFAKLKQLSVRRYNHAKEIAATIAILAHSESVQPVHLKEGLSYIGVGLI